MSGPVLRTATVGVASVVLVPLLLLNAYLLAWFLPELTGGHRFPWIATCVLTAMAVGCLALGWIQRHRTAWWWLWPLAAAVLIAASLPVVERL